MDNTALTLCMDIGLPIIVFDMRGEGNIRRAVWGEQIGTFVGRTRGRAPQPGDLSALAQRVH